MFHFGKKKTEASPSLLFCVGIAKKQLEETEKRVRERGTDTCMTYRLQIKDDCTALQRLIRQIEKGTITDHTEEELKNRIIRLQTSTEMLLGSKKETK